MSGTSCNTSRIGWPMSEESGLRGVRIEPITLADLGLVARIHRRAFPRSALTRLGVEAVRRYYEWQLVGPHDRYAVQAVVDGRMAGFNFAGVSRGAVGGFLARNKRWLMFRVATRPWLLANPIVLRKARSALGILGLVRRPVAQTGGTAGAEVFRPERSFGILSIAVDPAFQGKGVAQLLMADAEREAREQGFHHMHLTVAVDNHRAIRFYEKMGWRKLPEGESWSGYMEKWVAPGNEAGESPDA